MKKKNNNNVPDYPVDDYSPFMSKKSRKVKKEFEISEEVRILAENIIKEQKLDVHPAKIEYLIVRPYITKTVAGRCIRSGKEFKFFTNFDYLVEVSGELWDVLELETRKILLEHELRHILITQNDKTGEWEFQLRDHDVQDFSCIINKHGIDWIRQVKLSISSLYDMTPAEEDGIKI